MKSTFNKRSPIEIVASYFELMRAGNTQQALQCWTLDAMWHVTGRSKHAGDYSPRDYVTLCEQWYVDYPQYRAELGAMTGMGELVFFNVTSMHGEAPESTQGMMLYRVVDGQISEGWAIPAAHGDRYTF